MPIFCSMKIWYSDRRRNSHGWHRWDAQKLMRRSLCKTLIQFVISMCDTYWIMAWFTKFPDTIDICSQFSCISCISCKTRQTHDNTDSQNVELGIHIDIKSIFLTIFLTFWWIFKFPDPYQNLLTFSSLFQIFPFSWLFPDPWEPWY